MSFIQEQEKLIKKLRENRYSLFIQRLPRNTKREFTLFAEKEFCDDYGMALKWLWDFFKGAMPNGLEDIYARIEALEKRMEKTEQEDKSKSIRLLNGREIRRK